MTRYRPRRKSRWALSLGLAAVFTLTVLSSTATALSSPVADRAQSLAALTAPRAGGPDLGDYDQFHLMSDREKRALILLAVLGVVGVIGATIWTRRTERRHRRAITPVGPNEGGWSRAALDHAGPIRTEADDAGRN